MTVEPVVEAVVDEVVGSVSAGIVVWVVGTVVGSVVVKPVVLVPEIPGKVVMVFDEGTVALTFTVVSVVEGTVGAAVVVLSGT